MKQVKTKYYDLKYFEHQSASPDFFHKLKPADFHKKYKEISSLTSLKSTDAICDYGCGNGDLSFLLYLQHHCRITAIDYSPDAIKICQSKLELFQQNTNSNATIKFLNNNNQTLPKLKKIKAVYFCDVFEHLYPHEINLIINQISKWGNPDIVIHTDNNIYLKYILPFFYFVALLTKKTTLKKLKTESLFDKKRHINLTNPKKLTQNMAKLGYRLHTLKFPQIDKKTIQLQLGSLSKFNFLINISFYLLKHFSFLSPSFYALYQKQS